MDSKIRNGLIEFGIGVASVIVVEALTTTIHGLEKDGKLNRKEADRVIKEAAKRYEVETTKYAKEAEAQFNDLIKASPFATKKEIAALNAKIDKLAKLSKKSGSKKRR